MGRLFWSSDKLLHTGGTVQILDVFRLPYWCAFPSHAGSQQFNLNIAEAEHTLHCYSMCLYYWCDRNQPLKCVVASACASVDLCSCEIDFVSTILLYSPCYCSTHWAEQSSWVVDILLIVIICHPVMRAGIRRQCRIIHMCKDGFDLSWLVLSKMAIQSSRCTVADMSVEKLLWASMYWIVYAVHLKHTVPLLFMSVPIRKEGRFGRFLQHLSWNLSVLFALK